jgi:hypothetical protein
LLHQQLIHHRLSHLIVGLLHGEAPNSDHQQQQAVNFLLILSHQQQELVIRSVIKANQVTT